MNERQWWSSHVRPAWHQPGHGLVSFKVEEKHGAGLFDTISAFRGVIVATELKWIENFPARDGTLVMKDQSLGGTGLSPEQRRYLELWKQGGGLSYILLGVGKSTHHEWFLFPLDRVINAGQTQGEIRGYCELKGQGYKSLEDIPAHFIGNFHGNE